MENKNAMLNIQMDIDATFKKGIDKIRHEHTTELRKQRLELEKHYNEQIAKMNKKLKDSEKNMEKLKQQLSNKKAEIYHLKKLNKKLENDIKNGIAEKSKLRTDLTNFSKKILQENFDNYAKPLVEETDMIGVQMEM